jgi:hypothetical protein
LLTLFVVSFSWLITFTFCINIAWWNIPYDEFIHVVNWCMWQAMKENKMRNIWPTLFAVVRSVRSTALWKLKKCTRKFRNNFMAMELYSANLVVSSSSLWSWGLNTASKKKHWS